mmetsp:Transcript_9987/g.8774  ORF Transcript_9987/g.8774 Transcript_9987/m.8774 type:complete len:222 (+) Transcript_9987:10-675(+)
MEAEDKILRRIEMHRLFAIAAAVALGTNAACLPSAHALVTHTSSLQPRLCSSGSWRHSAPQHRYSHSTECGSAGNERWDLALRLRGGAKEIPIDMKIFYWLENLGGYYYVVTAMLAGAWYLTPPLPDKMVMSDQRWLELQWALVALTAGSLMFLAGPIIEGYLGAWSLGGAPISQMIIMVAVTYIWQAVGETVADARDQQLRAETLDPTLPSIRTNYRIMG